MKKKKKPIFESVTKILFVTGQFAAIVWVSISYLIALYSTIWLEQVFPAVELSGQAISTIIGVNMLKVLENIFEHNNSAVFGYSDTAKAEEPATHKQIGFSVDEEPAEDEEEEHESE